MQRLTDAITSLTGWRRAVVALLAGAFAAFGQAPFDFPLVCLVSFPVLVWLLDGASAAGNARLKPAFAVGWWFGFGYFLSGLWWVGSAVLFEGEQYAWALPFVVLGLPALLAFFYGLATTLARLLWRDGLARIFALAFAFGVAEWLREFVLTGFPWNPVGLAAMPTPLLMQSVGLVGMIGMNVLAVVFFALPAILTGRIRARGLGAAIWLALLAAHVGYGAFVLRAPLPPGGSSVAVRIVQPNIDLSQKWDNAARDQVFRTLVDLSTQAPPEGAPKPQLIVWPETSMPYLLPERPDALAAIGDFLEDGQMLLAGAIRPQGDGSDTRYYNAILAIDSDGKQIDAVDKVHLVPFGEYIPFADLFAKLGVEQIVAGPMNYVAGTGRHAIAVPGGLRAIPYICYEMIFPGLMPQSPQSGSFIVTITNDAWFGNTPGPYQHLRQAQVRAVETGLPVLRAANTGVSAAINSRGQVVVARDLGTKGTIDAVVSDVSIERTVQLSPHQTGAAIALIVGLIPILSTLRLKFQRN